MAAFTLKQSNSPQEVARHFARDFAAWIPEREEVHLALSGGSTPRLLFQYLAEHYKEQIDWQKLHFYWGDERCVPPDHPESNFKMAHELLLQHIDIPPENIHRIYGEADPAEEARRYAQVLETNLPDENDLPVFDLILLGMGSDGHTASIFPDQMELMTSGEVCAVATHPETGQQRITLTGPVINNARQVAFLITGESKRKVFGEILHRTGRWETYPASHIQPTTRGGLHFYVDEAVIVK